MEIKNFDKDLSRLVSYLTFDGHLSQDLKCFYLSSKNEETLLDFKNTVYRKFSVLGRIEDGMGYNNARKYRIFSRAVCKLLKEIGVPEGNKVSRHFLVPVWIKDNNEFAREYLRTAFDCEGSIWYEKEAKIRFGIFKTEKNIPNGLQFLAEMKFMLSIFNINTTETWLMKGNLRKDGKLTQGLYFKIKQDSVVQFAKAIGFNDRFKNKRLILI